MDCYQCHRKIYPHNKGDQAGQIEWLVDQFGVGLAETLRATHRECNYFNSEHRSRMMDYNLFDRWLPLFGYRFHSEIYDEQFWDFKSSADEKLKKLLEARHENHNP